MIGWRKKAWIFGMVTCWSLHAFAGILPDFEPKLLRKKQPLESLEQASTIQVEVSILPSQIAKLEPQPVARPMSIKEQSMVDYYTHLADASAGQFYSALDRPLMESLDELLQNELVDGADIVFLIDHTSSMEDDIDEIRQDLNALIAGFRQRAGVRVGIVTFSDVKSGSRYGYCAQGLSNNYDQLSQFLSKVELLGSVEDIYGAIYKTVSEFSWQSKSKRMLVIISDEMPATGNDTNHTQASVLEICAKHKVKTNLYPVLVDKYSLPVGN